MINIFLFAVGILLGSIGWILMKIWASKLPPFSFSIDYLISMFSNLYILVSFILYFIPALIWTYLLTKYDISFVQPMLSLTYVVTPLLAMFIIDEKVSVLRWLWIVIIIIWVFIVSKS